MNRFYFAGSSNGRTSPSEGEYLGSNPGPAASYSIMKYIVIIIFLLALGGIIYFTFISKPSSQVQEPQIKTMENGLKIEDIKIGNGAEAKAGVTITVNYLGTLLNGVKFDSSYDRGQPFSFLLGARQVIPGWDEGLLGMKVGGKRKLTIPPSLAYGEKGVPGAIPANSTLVFEVELLGVK